MNIISTFTLAAVGVLLAAANTTEEYGGSSDVWTPPGTGDMNEEFARRAELREAQERAKHKKRPSESLGLESWICLMNELGWWDDSVSEAEFTARLDAWDATAEQLESQSASSESLPQSASAASLLLP